MIDGRFLLKGMSHGQLRLSLDRPWSMPLKKEPAVKRAVLEVGLYDPSPLLNGFKSTRTGAVSLIGVRKRRNIITN